MDHTKRKSHVEIRFKFTNLRYCKYNPEVKTVCPFIRARTNIKNDENKIVLPNTLSYLKMHKEFLQRDIFHRPEINFYCGLFSNRLLWGVNSNGYNKIEIEIERCYSCLKLEKDQDQVLWKSIQKKSPSKSYRFFTIDMIEMMNIMEQYEQSFMDGCIGSDFD